MKNQILTTVAIIGLGMAGSGVAQAQTSPRAQTSAQAPYTQPAPGMRAHRQSQYLSRQEIRHLQERLTVAGFYDGRIDGIVGPKTRHAVARFQQQHGLAETARLDPETVNALRNGAGVGEGSSGQYYPRKMTPERNLPPGHLENSTSGSGSSTAEEGSSPYPKKMTPERNLPKTPLPEQGHLQNGSGNSGATAGEGSSQYYPQKMTPQRNLPETPLPK